MNDTCATHRSRVPRRSFGRVKWGVTTVEDERGPGLDFNLCFVCGSRPWGAAAFHLCLFILLLKCVKCSPVPASFFPYLSTSLQYHYDFISHNSEFISHNSDFFLWILSLHLTFVFLDGNKLIYMHPVSPGEKDPGHLRWVSSKVSEESQQCLKLCSD